MTDKKIRIGFILTKLELGGAQKHVLSLIEHLDAERFETFLMTSSQEAPLLPYAKELLGERLILSDSLQRAIQPLSDLRAVLEIRSILKEIQVDIVHTHSSKAGIVGRWAAWKAKVPAIIHTVHGFGFTPQQPIWETRLMIGAEQKAARVTDRIVAVSKAVIDQACQLNIGVRSQYEWIPCGIDRRPFEQVPKQQVGQFKRELGIPADAPLVTQVACFKPQKAPLDFVKVASAVARRFPLAYFLMVGDGELRLQIEREQERLGLGQRLILTGWRWDIPVILSASDVIVLTSHWEGLPTTLLEAMASAKPVVATNVGGVCEVIRDGENGFLVKAGDIVAISQAIARLLDHPRLAATMGEQSREQFSSEYDLAETVERLGHLYQSMVRDEAALCQASSF